MAGFSDTNSFTKFDYRTGIRITGESGFQRFTDRETEVCMLMRSAEIFDSNKGEGTERTRIRVASRNGNQIEVSERNEFSTTVTDYEEIFPLELTVEHRVEERTFTFTNQPSEHTSVRIGDQPLVERPFAGKDTSFLSLSVRSEVPRNPLTSPISVAAASPSLGSRSTEESNLAKLLRGEIEEDATTIEDNSASDSFTSDDEGSLRGSEVFFVGNPLDRNYPKGGFLN